MAEPHRDDLTPRGEDRGLHRAVEASPTSPTAGDALNALTPRSGSRAAQRSFLSNLESQLNSLETPREGAVEESSSLGVRRVAAPKATGSNNIPFQITLPEV